MNIYDVIVIGAGPSGLFTAINCAEDDRKVLILEKNSTPGKKLLLSGAGQCNITHEGSVKELLKFYGNNNRFMKHVLYSFNNNNLLDFFEQRGLSFITNDNGKIFPKTLNASDVLDILIKECKKRNVEINYSFEVENVNYDDKNNVYIIKSEDKEYYSRVVVIATGGKSYTKTGSTGEGYKFASSLGHSIIQPLPALTPLYINNYQFEDLAGISFDNVLISLWKDNKKIKETTGDIIFTHESISGPGILNFSRYILPGNVIKINFIGQKNIDEFRKSFLKKIQLNGKLMVKTILKEYSIPKRFIHKVLKLACVDDEITAANLNKEKRKEIIKTLTEFPMEVKKLGGFHIAMATRGGVSLQDIDSKTMESKKLKGLYFVGEVLDIDGDTGGYNIQAAFSTGYIAANSINNSFKMD